MWFDVRAEGLAPEGDGLSTVLVLDNDGRLKGFEAFSKNFFMVQCQERRCIPNGEICLNYI
jgi:hypothetical protein